MNPPPDVSARRRRILELMESAFIVDLVESAPPLTDDQRDRLRVLLRPTPSESPQK